MKVMPVFSWPFKAIVFEELVPNVLLPLTEMALLTVVVPVDAPMLTVVAAPPMFRVVAMVFIRLKVVWSVVKFEPLVSLKVPPVAPKPILTWLSVMLSIVSLFPSVILLAVLERVIPVAPATVKFPVV